MDRLFCINEDERSVGKSYQLARFCIAKTMLGDANCLAVLAASFRMSKMVLNYVHEILNEMKVFHEMNRISIEHINIILLDGSEIYCVPINSPDRTCATHIVLDEFRMIPHEIISELEQNYGLLTDIREHNLFELKGQKHACV